MTSKAIVLRALDRLIAGGISLLVLSMAGVPVERLSGQMSAREFRGFALFVIYATLWLMYEIGTSDSAP